MPPMTTHLAHMPAAAPLALPMLELNPQDKAAILQAGLALHNANLPIWDRRTFPKRPPANDLIQRLKQLSEMQQTTIWQLAIVAEHGIGPANGARRPHRLMVGFFTHLTVMAELTGNKVTDMVPQMTWPDEAPKAERFVRLLLASAGLDGEMHDEHAKKLIAQLLTLAEPVFKKRSGQGGVRELRALSHKLSAISEARGDARLSDAVSKSCVAQAVSPLRSPRVLERPLLSASRRASQSSLPEYEVAPPSQRRVSKHAADAPGGAISPDGIGTPSEDSFVAPYNELVNQLRARPIQGRRTSTLSLSSSWAALSDEQSTLSEGHDSWQDLGQSDA